MQEKIITDTKLLRMIDKEGMTQSEAAKELGVTRQAVFYRLRSLRGRTSYVVASAKVEQAIDSKIDVMVQLKAINEKAHELLNQVEGDHQLAVKIMGEIRNQLRLSMDIFESLYSLDGAAKFQQAVLETLEECDPDLRKRVIDKLNEQSGLRSALRFK